MVTHKHDKPSKKNIPQGKSVFLNGSSLSVVEFSAGAYSNIRLVLQYV